MNDLKPQQEAIFRNLAEVAHALANPHRLKIISLLSHSRKTVEQLAGLIGQSLAATSAHLKVLRVAGLVDSTKAGRYVQCRLSHEKVEGLWLTLRDFGVETVPEIREIVRNSFATADSASPLNEEEVYVEIEAERALLIDLRPGDEYTAGHLPGARSLPYADLAKTTPAFPRDRDLLTYCRGPYCLMAIDGTLQLREMGWPVRRLRFGIPEWRQHKLPVETTP